MLQGTGQKQRHSESVLQRLETPSDFRAETTRADRATAMEAMLLKEIESIDKNAINECHNAMEGFMVMYFDECGSSA